MIIGVAREIKVEEFRVGLTPAGARELAEAGHSILVEKDAGSGSGFPDEEYGQAGAVVVPRNAVFGTADLIVKVKEPVRAEFPLIRDGVAIFTYLHLAPNPDLTKELLKKRVAGLAYETLERDGKLPLLAPMSEIAGRMAPLMAAFYLQKFKGGSGVLPTGVSGVRPGKIVVLGAGVVGTNAARVGIGLGMETVVINKDTSQLQRIDEQFKGRVQTIPLSAHAVEEEIRDADMVVGAVLVPGGRTPVLIPKAMLGSMKKGTVIVDVAVDQGGCVETSRPTTHDDPVYEVEGIVHYCVANMPGAYPRTSTLALTNATLRYVKTLADSGIEKAIHEDPAIRSALNTYQGRIMNEALAGAMGAKT
ncbi:MAG: alanine dehydrogenase [Nitrospirae bacterium GWD2_57_9]|nr:MAG: alanine dehydrogenase [Nitrospirae bacterium GWD2_57_9]